MGVRAARRATRGVLLASLLAGGIVVPLVAGAAEGDPGVSGAVAGDRPPLWSSTAAAAAINVEFNSDPPLLPLEEFIRVQAPYGESSWDSGGRAQALASAFYPGVAGTRGPKLLCEFQEGLCPEGFPPDIPIVAEASHPTTPDAAAQPEGSATAHAGQDYVETYSGGSGMAAAILGPLAVAIEVGSFDTHTSQTFSEDGSTVIGYAETHLEDILIAGTIAIDSLTAFSTSSSAGEGAESQDSGVVISGANIAGTPIEITEEGIVLADTATGTGPLDDVVSQIVEGMQSGGFGMGIRLLGSSSTIDAGTVTSSARGLLIEFSQPFSGPTFPSLPTILPPEIPIPIPQDPNFIYREYVGSVVVGLADSSAFVSTTGFGLGDLGGLGSLGSLGEGPGGSSGASGPTVDDVDTQPPPASTAPSGSSTVLTPPLSVGGSTTSPDGSGTAPTVTDPSVAPPQTEVVTVASTFMLGDAAADRLEAIYLGFGLVALLTLIGSRVSARLVGRRH